MKRYVLLALLIFVCAACSTVSQPQSRGDSPTGKIKDAHVFDPEASGLSVSINGVAVGLTGPMRWNWGDGTTTESWFPATHAYSSAGKYAVTVKGSLNTTAGRRMFTRKIAVTVN